jgi:hypothetical protein
VTDKSERPVSVNGERTLWPFATSENLTEMDVALALAQVVTYLHEPGGGGQVGVRWDDDHGEIIYEVRQGSPLRSDLREVRLSVDSGMAPQDQLVEVTVPQDQQALDRSWILEPEGEPEGEEFITGWVEPPMHPRFAVVRLHGAWWARTGRCGAMRLTPWSTLANYLGTLREGRRCTTGLRRLDPSEVDRCLLPDYHDDLHVAYGSDGGPFLYFATTNPSAVLGVVR